MKLGVNKKYVGNHMKFEYNLKRFEENLMK